MNTVRNICFLLLLSLTLSGLSFGQEQTKDEIDKKEDRAVTADGVRKNEKRRINFTGRYKLYYDSNPEFVSSGEDEDWVHGLSLGVKGKLFEQDGNRIGGQYTLSGDWHADIDEKDLLGHVVNLYYGHDFGKANLRFDYIFSHYSEDNEEYLLKHSFAPLVFFGTSRKTLEMVRVVVSANEYPDMGDYDGTDWSLQLRHFHFLDAEKKKRLSVGYKYASNDADDDDNSYDSHRIRTDFKFPLPNRFSGLVELAYTAKEFEGGRDDGKVEYGLEFSRPINEYLVISFGHNGTDNDSDASGSDYQRNVTFVAAKVSF